MEKILHLSLFLMLGLINVVNGSDFFQSFGRGNSNPFGIPQSNMGRSGAVDDEYYKRLGVDSTASIDEIKKAYRKQAMKYHPDKGGDAEQFKLLSEAYEILSDDEKRTAYDRYGKPGVSSQGFNGNGGGGFGGFADIFRGFGGFNIPVVMQLDLSLEDLFNGREVNIPIRGSSVINVKIEPGMMGGQQLVARGHMVDGRGVPRDLVFRLNELKHPIFTRRNADLLMELKISLKDALLGFERSIRHLDGKDLWIRTKKGDITSSDDVVVLKDMGMPVYGSKLAKGRLFIRFRVEFPKKMWLEKEDLQEFERLVKVLPTSQTVKPRKRRAEETLTPFTPSDLSSFGEVGAQVEDEEESPFAQFFFR